MARRTPKILVLAGSIRTGALSGKLAALAARDLAAAGAEVTHISLADYPLPIMDEDLEREKGVPDNALSQPSIGRESVRVSPILHDD